MLVHTLICFCLFCLFVITFFIHGVMFIIRLILELYIWLKYQLNDSATVYIFYREHLIRLQHENKMLKLAQEGSDNEKIALLQSLLEDANRRKNELETENRSGNKLAAAKQFIYITFDYIHYKAFRCLNKLLFPSCDTIFWHQNKCWTSGQPIKLKWPLS